MTKWVLRLGVLLVVGTTTACGSDGPTVDDPPTLSGTYQLQMASSRPVPTRVVDQVIPDPEGDFRFQLDVLAGTLELEEGGRYTQSIGRRAYMNGQQISLGTWTDHGTWATQGNALRLDSDLYENHTVHGTFANGTVMLEQELSNTDGDVAPVAYGYGKQAALALPGGSRR